MAKTKFTSKFVPYKITEPIHYVLLGCLNEKGSNEPNQKNFAAFNVYRTKIGLPFASFNEFLEWCKT